MSFRNTLILVAVFALLGGYVYLVEMQKPAETPTTVDKDKYVFTLGEQDLRALQLKDGDKSVYLARGDDGTWYVGALGGAEADLYQMSSVLSGLTDLKASRVITDLSAGLAAYGLEPPSLQAIMELSEDKSETLLVGDVTPQGSAYYAQRKGSSSIYLIPEYLVVALSGLVANPPYVPTPTAVVTGTTVPVTR